MPKSQSTTNRSGESGAGDGGGGGTAFPGDDELITDLSLLDPILQFLTRATGRPLVPLSTLRKALPGPRASDVLASIPDLARRGILRVSSSAEDDGGDDFAGNYATCTRSSDGAPPPTLEELHSRFIEEQDDSKDASVFVGFFSRPGHFAGDSGTQTAAGGGAHSEATSLHGSTKAGAKRRLAALKKSLKADKSLDKRKTKSAKINKKAQNKCSDEDVKGRDGKQKEARDFDDAGSGDPAGIHASVAMDTPNTDMTNNYNDAAADSHDSQEERDAIMCMKQMIGISEEKKRASRKTPDEDSFGSIAEEKKCNDGEKVIPSERPEAEPLLSDQAKFAGCSPARQARYGFLSDSSRQGIPRVLSDAFGLDIDKAGACGKKLFRHQCIAVESILKGNHTTVCTGTGSGKSLCFLLPVLATVMNKDIAATASLSDEVQGHAAALIMFPTKALAQDQYTKLVSLVNTHPVLQDHLRPGVIDGDTPHANRADIAENCNLILTNPDTIHAAILPNWKRTYKTLLSRIGYIVMDESHMYEGAFGAHVSLVLSRLLRVCAAAFYTSNNTYSEKERIVFVACSATLGQPEEHFRLLCPIDEDDTVTVLSPDDDGSPCGAKYFFTWNPPLLDQEGKSTGRLVAPRGKDPEADRVDQATANSLQRSTSSTNEFDSGAELESQKASPYPKRYEAKNRRSAMHRRHAADETARLLAEAVRNGVRCIAFCKTRSLCEWVYERCVTNLRGDGLSSKVESYRGGYSAEARRSIETLLFRGELIGVVATSALELGVDIGGIDLTFHCGYPGSISSLMQQSGRAGRGGKPSVSIMICFGSPAEQHLWRSAKSLLSRGLDAPPSVPVNAGILQGHLLCAGDEYPLVGDHSILTLLTSEREIPLGNKLTDRKLFAQQVYDEVIEKLRQSRLLCENSVTVRSRDIDSSSSGGATVINTCSTHPSVDKPWSRVSLRSIEPISYSIVDLCHNLQGGRTDKINEKAVMDSIPYSRVFYHAFPGAVIMHRGKKFKVESMNAPPPFADGTIGYCRSIKLGAFAKQTSVAYSTRALALTHITVVKQFERVELLSKRHGGDSTSCCSASLAAEKCSSSSKDAGFSAAEAAAVKSELHYGSIAGNGVVTVKRTVHGYKKLSPVNRVELSRHELKMPSMEYDTNAIWFDVEASLLTSVLTDFDAGVHALSHALLAVAPLFVPCTSSDLDCDHSKKECTRVMLFDSRAGGAGIVSRLWRHFFRPGGILSSAIELLEYCSTCSDDSGFKGGCPGCLQSVPCMNFHEDLSRSAGLYIARHLLKRLEQTDLYKKNSLKAEQEALASTQAQALSTPEKSSTEKDSNNNTPRRLARKRALRFAKDLHSAKKRSVIVGRPTWPGDERL